MRQKEGVWPEGVVQQVCGRRQGAPEGDPDVRVGPPGHDAGIDKWLVAFTAREESKQLHGGVAQRLEQWVCLQFEQVNVVVCVNST